MEPEQRKDFIRTAILVVLFLAVGLFIVKVMIGDPMSFGPKPDLGY